MTTVVSASKTAQTRIINLLHLNSSVFATIKVQKRLSALESLPQEILMVILELLPPASGISISLASKHIAHIAFHTMLQWDLNSLTEDQREMLTSDDQISFYLMPDYTMFMHWHKSRPGGLLASHWIRVCAHCGLWFTFPRASGMTGKKTVSRTAEHLAEHLMHHGGFIGKGLMALVEEAVRIRTKTLLQELE